MTSIGQSAFKGCIGLISATTPNSVTSIEKETFAGCQSLTSIVIGSGVTSIGFNAFNNTNLKKTIWLTNTPPSGYNYVNSFINYVSNDQFSSIKNVVKYQFLSSYFDVDGIRYVPVSPSDRTCDAIDCIYDNSIKEINIGKTVTNKNITLSVKKVNPYICYGNPCIKNIYICFDGDIGEYAFYGCQALTSATISNKGNLGSCIFYDCNALTIANISNSGYIGSSAFYGCTSLENVELGKKVTSIGSEAFYGCANLQSIIIPDAVISIGSSAFNDCSSMESAKIGSGLKVINEYTFSGCSSLKDLTIGSQVRTINQYAFQKCSSLPIITIPNAVTEIKNYVFNGCTGLKKVFMSDSNMSLSLGSNAKKPLFSDCPLDSVYIGRDISYNKSSDCGYSPFYRNTSLHAVKITDKETEISQNEFYGCTNLQRVIIGDGVITIGDWAFSGCSSLKYFSFGSQMKTIGKEAFSDCTTMVEICSKASTPPTCGTQALDDINKWECKLFVPEGTMTAYQAADQWKDFFFIEEGYNNSQNSIVSVNINAVQVQVNGNTLDIFGVKAGTAINVYDTAGRLVGTAKAFAGTTSVSTSLQNGEIGIVKIGDKVLKIIIK